MRRAGLPAALVVAGAVALAGPGGGGTPAVGGHPDPAAVRTVAAAPYRRVAPVAQRAVPVRLLVPAIGVAAPVRALGLNPDGSLEVPAPRRDTGWFAPGAVPGETGPAVVAGHVSLAAGRAVFARLHELRPGDRVDVERSDGLTARFVVRRVERHPKDAFPTGAVYGPTAGPELRLVTCGGAYDRRTRSYLDNVVVYAGIAG